MRAFLFIYIHKMILEDATYEAYEYYPRDLKHKTSKRIVAACELCGEFKIVRRNCYHRFCRSCTQKGKHRSKESRAKMSAAKKGKNHPMFNKHPTEKSRALMSAAKSGKHRSDETKAKISKNHADFKGEKSGRWLDGISFKPYCVKFNKEYKDKIRTMFGGKCILCGKTTEKNERKLDVHHVNYNKDCGCDGTKCICVPLCRSCHMKTNGNRDYWQKIIVDKLHSIIIW